MTKNEIKEGFIKFKGYKTYFKLHGNLADGKTPLILLHGGPGYTHYHLENLSGLASGGRPVIFYDQLGCGNSDRPDNPMLWTVTLFIEEINAVRSQLGLENIHILGHSWGGSLAAEYMLTKPVGVEKIILSSPLLDSKLWVKEANRLIDGLPAWARDTMHKHEADDSTDSVEYQEAYMEFRGRHICRLKPYPLSLLKADRAAGAQVYNTMWGPSETKATGVLKEWSVLSRLNGITIPALFLSGKYDEATHVQMELGQKNLPGSKWTVFEHCSHSANLEEPDKYMAAVDDFLIT